MGNHTVSPWYASQLDATARMLDKRWHMIPFHIGPRGISFAVKVQSRAKKNAITGEFGDALKLSVTAPPVEGRANQACIEFFAGLLNLSPSSVTIASGESSRRKVVRVMGISAKELQERLYKKPASAAAGRSCP